MQGVSDVGKRLTKVIGAIAGLDFQFVISLETRELIGRSNCHNFEMSLESSSVAVEVFENGALSVFIDDGLSLELLHNVIVIGL